MGYEKKYKVVHVISNLSMGGAQILLFDILNNLKRNRDLDIILITIDSGEYIDRFEKAGFKVFDVQEKGLLNPKIYFKIKKILKLIRPDIVHTHLNKADFYGRLAAKSLDIPVIYSTCHNYSTTHTGADINKRSISDFIDNFVVTYTRSNMIAISKLVRQYLINRNKKFDKITEVIYNGINIEKEKYILTPEEQKELRAKYGLTENDFVISIIGRLEKQKGHIPFLNSVKDFLKENPNFKILIIGDGSLRREIELFIESNLFKGRIRILGFIKNSEPYIEISDLICVPSLWEGFGLVILEAFIKRKIVLASNVGGIPEIIEEDKTGFLFDPTNKTELIMKLRFIYENMKSLERIKESALLVLKEKFDMKNNARKYYNSYKLKLESSNL